MLWQRNKRDGRDGHDETKFSDTYFRERFDSQSLEPEQVQQLVRVKHFSDGFDTGAKDGGGWCGGKPRSVGMQAIELPYATHSKLRHPPT